MDEHDPVPAYTSTPSTPADDLAAFLAANATPSQCAHLSLPLTRWPSPNPLSNPFDESAPRGDLNFDDASTGTEKPMDAFTLQTTLITTLFTALDQGNADVPPLLISAGLLSPDVTNAHGTTPLIAAVAAGSGPSVCALLNLGAQVNLPGRWNGRQRTPLMVAATLGRLALVRLLMEDFGADDAAVAEDDGYIALRLAADAGHREVVAYLPARRAGAWRRVSRHFHEVVVRRARKLGYEIWRFVRFFVWSVPRFFVWDCLGRPACRGCKWCWQNRGRFAGWCKGQARAMPGRLNRAGKAMWSGVKRAPGAAWRAAKKVPGAAKKRAEAIWAVLRRIPGVLERLVKAVWRVMKRIPGTLSAVLEILWGWLRRVGGAVANVLLRVVSVLHTAVTAVLGFFRTITLKDVWNGVCAVFRAAFVNLPKAIWSGVKTVGDVVYMVFIGLFGFVGQLIIWIFQGLWWLANYIPVRLWKILCGIGSATANGFHEIMVLFNPKY